MGFLPSQRNLRMTFAFLLITALIALFYFASNNIWESRSFHLTSFSSDKIYSHWPLVSVSSPYSQKWLRSRCLIDRFSEFSISSVSSIVDQWSKSADSACRKLFTKFTKVFHIEKQNAPLLYPGPFQKKVRAWLGNSETLFQQALHQEVIHVHNYFTREHTVFNPLRDKRPVSPPKEPEIEYVNRLILESKRSCDFCNYQNFTAEHIMHRLESQFAFTASNAFKVDKWHALFVFKTHHPHNWNLTQYMDVMNLSMKWFLAASAHDSSVQYPVIVWDILPHAGASQVHPHLHGFIDQSSYQGVVEMWRAAAEDYYRMSGDNYFQDLIHFHSALGLAVQHGNAVAYASLLPKKDHEVVIISPEAGESFFQLIFFVLRAFIDDLKKLCISLGIGLPPLRSVNGQIPAYARIVTRGAVADIRTDMSSFELFSATNVNIDPWKVIVYINNSIKKRS